MNTLFSQCFFTVFQNMMSIFIVAVGAGFLVRRGLIPQEHVKILSGITVRLLLPCMIFSKIGGGFDPAAMPDWWILPLSGMAMVLFGIGFSALLFFRELPRKKSMLALSGLQNAGYLVLALGQLLFPDRFDEFALYCFLYILGVSPLLWSIGKYMSTSGSGTGFSLKGLVTPPLAANILALLFVFSGARNVTPAFVMNSISLLGSATVPLATFVLGATLSTISFKHFPPVWDVIRVVVTKFAALPLVTMLVLYLAGMATRDPLLCKLLVMEAASAPATGLILQVRHYGGDAQEIGSMMIVCYLVCMIVLPVWIGLWSIL